MLDMLDRAINNIKEYVAFAIGLILLILRWQHQKINKIESEIEKKYVSKELFDEFRKGLFDRLDRMEQSLKEDIKEIKDKIK